jgi:hypothetical protein
MVSPFVVFFRQTAWNSATRSEKYILNFSLFEDAMQDTAFVLWAATFITVIISLVGLFISNSERYQLRREKAPVKAQGSRR